MVGVREYFCAAWSCCGAPACTQVSSKTKAGTAVARAKMEVRSSFTGLPRGHKFKDSSSHRKVSGRRGIVYTRFFPDPAHSSECPNPSLLLSGNLPDFSG